eukprot:Rhum_TRINITY_DN18809_c0_g1::Rhum_TRINITY_DN18809_c0_g1_i1::g.168518::m.168518
MAPAVGSTPGRTFALTFLLCVTAAAATGDAPSGDAAFVKDSFSEKLAEDHAIIISTFGGCIAVLVGGVAALMLLGGKVRLPIVLSVGVSGVILLVGIVAWAVTYTTARNELFIKVEKQLMATSAAVVNIDTHLTAGTMALGAISDYTRTGVYNTTYGTFPLLHLSLYPLLKSTLMLSKATTLIYTGSPVGVMNGVFPQKPGSSAAVFIGTRGRNTTLPAELVCKPAYDHPGCAGESACADPSGAAACPKTCGHPPSQEMCGPPRGAEYDEQTRMIMAPVQYSADRTQLTLHPDASWGVSTYQYDARRRPWFTTNRSITWSDPYAFGGMHASWVGFTSSVGLVSTTGQDAGCAAVDYTLGSIAPLLADICPTPRSIVFLATPRWHLLSSSLSEDDLHRDTGLSLAEVVVISKAKHDSRLRWALSKVASRHGGLARATASKSLIVEGAEVVMSFPSHIEGGLEMLTVVMMPYDDVAGHADEVSTTALLVVLGISVGIGALVLGAITLALRPLQRLATDMQKVAWMRLDDVTVVPTSAASEIRSMQESFVLMVQTLRGFRQYLPEVVLDTSEAAADNEVKSVLIDACIVFTDIRGSTSCWEHEPEAMRAALKIHNAAIRRCILKTGGHEVKTIGDSFMVAFDAVEPAVRFALAVQEALLEQDWPPQLLGHGPCARTPCGLWGGLAVRIGLNYGECEVETQESSGRKDYFGHAVNKAARLESVCATGAVAVPTEVLAKMDPAAIGCPRVVPVGPVPLRGMNEAVDVSCLLPQALAGRLPAIQKELATKKQEGTTRRGKNDGGNNGLLLVGLSGGSTSGGLSRSSPRVGFGKRASESGKFNDRLQRVDGASVACVEARFDSPQAGEEDETLRKVNVLLAKVQTFAQKSGGTLLTATGESLTLAWNASKPCSRHAENSVSFVSMLRSATVSLDGCVFVGLSRGPVLGGVVGGQGQKFVTVMGRVVTLSAMLAHSAMDLGTFCLYCSPLNSDMPQGAAGSFRTADTWTISEPAQVLTVYDVNTAPGVQTSLASTSNPAVVGGETVGGPSRAWGNEYEAAYAAKDFGALERLTYEDSVAVKIVALLREGRSLRPPVNEYLLQY